MRVAKSNTERKDEKFNFPWSCLVRELSFLCKIISAVRPQAQKDFPSVFICSKMYKDCEIMRDALENSAALEE